MKKISQFAKSLKKQQEVVAKELLPQSEDYKKLSEEYSKKTSAYSKLTSEHNKLMKEFETLKQEREQLFQFRESVSKEKKDIKIKSELSKIAKELNVKDSAMEDVISLVKDKFAISEDEKIFVAGKETDNDAVQFMSSFLEGKDHFIQPVAAQPAKVPPVVNQPKQNVQVVPQQPTGQLFTNFFNRKK